MRHPSFVVLAAAVCGCVVAQQANMLSNPGFEELGPKGQPAGWTFQDFRTGGEPLTLPDAGRNGTCAVGSRSQKATERGAWQQTVGTRGAAGLHISGWYRTEELAALPGKGACVRLTYLKDGTGWDFIADKRHFMPPASDWTRFIAVLTTVPNTARVAVELFNFFAPGAVWFDDVAVRPATDEEVRQSMAQQLDRPATADRVSYAPADGATVSVNPPAFIWVPTGDISAYVLQYSPEADFSPAATTTVEDIPISVYTPTETLRPGTWYWRYGFRTQDDTLVTGKPRRFTIPDNATLYPRPTINDVLSKIPNERPRIYFTPETVARVRAEHDGKYRQITRGTIAAAEKKIGEELYPEPDWLPKSGQERGKAYLESFRTMRPFTSGMELCAQAYIYTGDIRFAQEAKRRLLHFATWDVEGPTSVSGNDEAAMDIAMRGPRTFDWIYDTLSDQQRALCTEFLGKRLEQISGLHHRMPFHSRPYSSHPGRMIGFMVEGCIVFAHEIPQAREWLDYTLRLLWSVYPIWGSDDGGWHEGIGYWTAYNSMMSLIVEELDRLGVPWKDKPYLRNTGWFGLYCAYPHRKHAAFGDGHEGGVGRGQGNLLYTLASIYDNPYFRWHAEQTGGGPTGPMAINVYRPDMEAKPPSDIPQARAFGHVGWVAMHSDMAHPADNVLMLLHSSPYGAISHNHANQNAFVLEAFGEPLAISSGYYQRYGSPHHAGWTWETKAHNSILVDGEGQVIRSPHSKGFVTEFENSDGFAYTTGDATAAYGGRLEKFLRHVLFCRPDYFVMLDELVGSGESTYQWLLHAKQQMQVEPEALRVTSRQGDAALRVQFLAPTNIEFSQTDQFSVAPEKADSPNQYHLTASTLTPSKTVQFVTVLHPYRDTDGPLPECRLLDAEGGTVLQVGSDIIAWKDARADEVRAGDLATSAVVAAVRRDQEGNVVSVFALGGGTMIVAGQKLR